MAFSKEFCELMENEQTAKEINALKDADEALKYFSEKGINLEEEISEFDTELDEDILSSVAGGKRGDKVNIWIPGRTTGIFLRRGYDLVVHGNANRTYTKYDYTHWMI